MLTIKQLRDNREDSIARLSKKGVNAVETIDTIIQLDDVRRATQKELDDALALINKSSKEIGELFKTGDTTKVNKLKEDVASVKVKSKEAEIKLASVLLEIDNLMVSLPNLPHSSVPKGKTPQDNEIVKEAKGRVCEKGGVPHWELIEKYNLLSFELGNKITGAGFPVYIDKGAKLQRALISYFLDKNTEAGFKEVMPPYMVNEASAYATGQLPDKEGQMYHATEDNLYLIPTAEVPVTNIYRDSIVLKTELPIKLTAYSACFRREAGSYGKDVRGLNRLHQFDKVEIVQICEPEESYKRLDEMVLHVENILKELELPYRILRLCGGDMSFTSALTYDFEVYSSAQDKWLEVSSVSNFESFQANRLKLRYKDGKEVNLLHTLNGSSLALPRIMASILENYQKADSIEIPKVLIPYMRVDKIS